MAVGVGSGGRVGASRGRVRVARRGRRAAAGAELRGPEAAGAGRRPAQAHEAPPQGAALRTRETPQSAQEGGKEGQEEINTPMPTTVSTKRYL